MKKGRFVVVEGLDGSGKATQLKLLIDYCHQQKIKTATVDFPQYYKTFFGRLVARYLKGEFGQAGEVNPYLASLPYAGDRWQAKPVMTKALKNGRLLLVNRYTSSNMGFMGAKVRGRRQKEKFLRWLIKLEWEILACPEPDLVIYLSIPPRVGQRLVDKKGNRRYLGNKAGRDIHERNLKYLERVAGVYLSLCQRWPYWVKIDCLDSQGGLKTRKAIHQEILGVLRRKKIL